MYTNSHYYVKMNYRTYICILIKTASSFRVLKKAPTNLDMNNKIINTTELQKYPSVQQYTFRCHSSVALDSLSLSSTT